MKNILVALLLLLTLLFYFYRYPDVIIRKNNEDNVYSPAYGKIIKIDKKDNYIYIAIFLSLLDVHYQFAPISGEVKEVICDRNGKFNLAYELNKSNDNEKCIHTITNKHGEFKVYQIAGKLVRRITHYTKPNTKIDSGECIGLIHFGSRVDIIIPNADKFSLTVNEHQQVNGSSTLLGYYA